MEVRLGRQFSAQLNGLVTSLKRWKTDGPRRLIKAHRLIGKRWHAEAVKRVPVDNGTLGQRIIDNTFVDSKGHITTEVGSNLPYSKFVEFGTERIAGGQVKALGDSPLISDIEAIKSWPAKTEGLRGVSVSGGGKEQMPWLRPAFNSIRAWAIKQIIKAVRPPRK